MAELHCKECRYWYGADTDARPFGTGRFAASRVLSAPRLGNSLAITGVPS